MILNFINAKTGETFQGVPRTDEEAKQLIPQHAPAQGLYDLYRAMGESILQAIQHVFEQGVAIHNEVHGKEEEQS